MSDGLPRSFDGMAAGRFVDMWGRETVFLPEELPDYVRNTRLALASTMDASGQIVGFPIDTMNHNSQEAAGWIVDVAQAEGRDVIEFTPRWNDLGRGAIGSDVMRFFSPTIDIEAKVIIGGSLTNWPATRNANHQILLRPVELSSQMQTYAEAPVGILEGLINKLQTMLSGLGKPEVIPAVPPQSDAQGDTTMPAELAVSTTPAPEFVTPVVAVDLSSPDIQLAINQRAEERAAVILAERQHAENITTLAARLIGGTPEQPQGLPIAHDALVSFLGKLPADLYPEAADILTAAATRSPLSFAELGHSRVQQGTAQLPDNIKPLLKAWIEQGLSKEDFFKANAVELGAMEDYNLTEFIKE